MRGGDLKYRPFALAANFSGDFVGGDFRSGE